MLRRGPGGWTWELRQRARKGREEEGLLKEEVGSEMGAGSSVKGLVVGDLELAPDPSGLILTWNLPLPVAEP